MQIHSLINLTFWKQNDGNFLFIYLFICLFVYFYLFIYLFIYLCIYLFIFGGGGIWVTYIGREQNFSTLKKDKIWFLQFLSHIAHKILSQINYVFGVLMY